MGPRRPLNPLAGLAGLVLLAFLPALRAGFLVDDAKLLLLSPRMETAEALGSFWFTAENPDYYPVTFSALWLERQAFGAQPMPYHLVNLLLHIVNTLLLLRFLRRLAVPAAWLGAALFAVHPLQAATVAWIFEQKNLLATLFSLLCLLSYPFPEQGASSKGRHSLSLVFFLLALLSKVTAAMLPPAILLLILWKEGRLRPPSLRPLVPFFALSLLLGTLGIWFQTARAGAVPTEGPAERLILLGRTFWFYLGKFLLPTELCFNYPRWPIEAGLRGAYLPTIALGALVLALWAGGRRWSRDVLVGLGLYGATIFPAMGVFDLAWHRHSYVADHFAYAALAAPAALAGAGFLALCRRAGRQTLLPWAAAPLVGALVLLSFQRARDFRDEEALWKDTLEKNPASFFAHQGLGIVYANRKDYPLALRHFQEAMRLRPEIPEAKTSAGIVLRLLGRAQEAAALWGEVLQADPDHPQANANLGQLRYEEGDRAEAIRLFRRALLRDAGSAWIHGSLGRILAETGRFEEGIAEIQEAIRLDPRHFETQSALGDALWDAGRKLEALPHYEKALEIQSNYFIQRELPRIEFRLSQALAEEGKLEAAKERASRAAGAARALGRTTLALEIEEWLRAND